MIQPDDHIAFLGVGSAGVDTHGLVSAVEADERAGGIETDPTDLRGSDACLSHGAADTRADSSPDVFARLFVEVHGWIPHLDVLLGDADESTSVHIHDACSG